MNATFDLITKLMVTGCICALLCFSQIDTSNNHQNHQVTATVKSLDTSWRYTKLGWQNSAHWDRPAIPKPMAAEIHPFVWTAMVLLAVLTLMIWSSPQKEVDSLVFKKAKRKPQSDAADLNVSSSVPRSHRKSCSACGKCKKLCPGKSG